MIQFANTTETRFDEQMASELFRLDVLAGRSTTSATWAGTPEHERAVYYADARMARRRLDVCAMAVAKHRAYQAAFDALLRAGLPDASNRLKQAIRAALDAYEGHLSREDSSDEVKEYERLCGLLPSLRLVKAERVPNTEGKDFYADSIEGERS